MVSQQESLSTRERGFPVLSWQIRLEQVDDEQKCGTTLGLKLQMVIYFICNNQLRGLRMIDIKFAHNAVMNYITSSSE